MQLRGYGVGLLVALLAGCGSSSSAGANGNGNGGSAGAPTTAGARGISGSAGSAGSSGNPASSASGGGTSGVGASSGGSSGGASEARSGGGSSGGGSLNPSCQGLAANCGATASADCCASSVVPGATFQRDNLAPPGPMATVSAFRLDIYDVSVARFRKFIAAYPGNKPSAGSGKNPKNATDPGWDATWSALLPVDQAALVSAVQCSQTGATYTTTVAGNEARSINCVDWYEAFAFCVWDDGRLPSDIELNNAAAAGAEQRHYPWSNPPESETIDASYAVYSPSATAVAIVGSKSPQGDGKWGHADLAGNVWNWVLDSSGQEPLPATCIDCAELSPAPVRIVRGGSFYLTAPWALVSAPYTNDPTDHNQTTGVRCARAE
jgi:formylglycine-generating enzyme